MTNEPKIVLQCLAVLGKDAIAKTLFRAYLVSINESSLIYLFNF